MSTTEERNEREDFFSETDDLQIEAVKKSGKPKTYAATDGLIERAILVALNRESGAAAEDAALRSLDELEELVETCGAEVLFTVLQNKSRPDPALYVGSGKLDEIKELAERHEASLLVFDEELSGSQMRNIEEHTGIKVLDRTLVILDIFASRATTREGKLQVELAQYAYRATRLVGLGKALSRLGGGIGTRGPGETKLESDRRHIRERITHLKRELAEVGERRQRVRHSRMTDGIMVAAIVGYTNAGKSTLINQLCDSDLFTMDQVFATLDPSARRLELDDGSVLVLVDTVGFIRKLPHHLVEAFQSTLEEARDADLIIQVTDVSDPEADDQIAVVEEQLRKLEATHQPRIHVLNKVDLLDGPVPERLLNSRQDGEDYQVIGVSAKQGMGLGDLKQALSQMVARGQKRYDLKLPYTESTLLAYIQKHARGLDEHYGDEWMELSFGIDKQLSGPIERYLEQQS